MIRSLAAPISLSLQIRASLLSSIQRIRSGVLSYLLLHPPLGHILLLYETAAGSPDKGSRIKATKAISERYIEAIFSFAVSPFIFRCYKKKYITDK